MRKIYSIFILLLLVSVCTAQTLDQISNTSDLKLTAEEGYLFASLTSDYMMRLDTSDFLKGIISFGNGIVTNYQGGLLKFVLESDSVQDISISFTLPDTVVKDETMVICSFDSMSACWVSGGDLIYWDPEETFTFRTNPAGRDSFYLGLNIDVRGIIDISGDYPCSVKCNINIPDTNISVESMILVSNYWREVWPASGYLANLEIGYAYDVDPGKNTIEPKINGNESVETMEFVLDGTPNDTFKIEFQLSQYLYHASSAKLSISFSEDDLYNLETKTYLNPNFPNYVLFDNSGVAYLSLGMNVYVDESSPEGDYYCQIYCKVCKPATLQCWITYGDYCVTVVKQTNSVELLKSGIHFDLKQNYPNPFNPVTIIKYELPRESFVKLSVFNMIGEKVASLVNENKPTGSYEVQFDGSKLPSGVYYCRLQTDAILKTIKILLVK